jgi:hypothetical protein
MTGTDMATYAREKMGMCVFALEAGDGDLRTQRFGTKAR